MDNFIPETNNKRRNLNVGRSGSRQHFTPEQVAGKFTKSLYGSFDIRSNWGAEPTSIVLPVFPHSYFILFALNLLSFAREWMYDRKMIRHIYHDFYQLTTIRLQALTTVNNKERQKLTTCFIVYEIFQI